MAGVSQPKRPRLIESVIQREINQGTNVRSQQSMRVNPSLVQRLGVEKDLEGHTGCVNCLAWNKDGTILASGSDDKQVSLWDAFSYKRLYTKRTNHTGNIFGVKFLPCSNDRILVSGADCTVSVLDSTCGEFLHNFSRHDNTVKGLEVTEQEPTLVWSAAEDGTVQQYDLRDPNSSVQPLLSLKNDMRSDAQIKCMALHPTRPHLMAIGADDPWTRLYDRRYVPNRSTSKVKADGEPDLDPTTTGIIQYFCPGYIPPLLPNYRKRWRSMHMTSIDFSADGNLLLSNLGMDYIHLYDISELHSGCPTLKELAGGHAYSYASCLDSWAPLSAESIEVSQKKKQEAAKDVDGKIEESMPSAVSKLKLEGNALFKKKKFAEAVRAYTKALVLAPKSALLYCNRSTALSNRDWQGDTYDAMKDARQAIQLDPTHTKAYYRLARALLLLGREEEGAAVLHFAYKHFPHMKEDSTCTTLLNEMESNIDGRQKWDNDTRVRPKRGDVLAENTECTKGEIMHREKSWDYTQRFPGHCNQSTDIKQAVFFGSESEYVLAGSDDGRLFVWDRHTGLLLAAYQADESILNIVQPHPTSCLIATSGIEKVIRLWSPLPEDVKNERQTKNVLEAAQHNHQNMECDPIGGMLARFNLLRDFSAINPAFRDGNPFHF